MPPSPNHRHALALLALLALPGCGEEKGGTPADAERLEQAGRWLEAAALHGAEALREGRGGDDGAVKRALLAYLMGNRLDEAERFASLILKREPERREVLFYLGDSQRVLQDYEGARATLGRLLAAEPGHLRGAFTLGHVLLRLGKAEEAEPLLRRVLGSAEAPAALRDQAEMELGRALRRLGRLRASADALAALLERSPHDTVALSEAAQTLSLLQRDGLARALRERYAWLAARGHTLGFEDASRLDGREGPPEATAARRALQAADRREFLPAVEGLEAALAADPADGLAAAALGRLWMRLQRPADALRAVERALPAARGESAELQRVRDQALLDLGKGREARARPGSDSRELRRRSAVAAGLGGDLKSAARELMALIRESPHDLESFEAFERVFKDRAAEPEVARVLSMKRSLEAKLAERETLLARLRSKPLREAGPECLALGQIALEAGSREEALDLLHLAADLLPADSESLRRLEGALRAPGEAFLRLHLLRRILGRSPGDREALRRLAALYLELDLRLEEAEAVAARFAALDPGESSAGLLQSIRGRRAALRSAP